jgi:hypothetical protein
VKASGRRLGPEGGIALHIIDNLFDTPINFPYSLDNQITNANRAIKGRHLRLTQHTSKS